MRVAVLHYHWKPGGVTRVVEQAQQALQAHAVELCLLGHPEQAALEVTAVEGLGYKAIGETNEANKLCEALTEAARNALGAEPDLWHIHNHSLGKHVAMADVVTQLASQGKPLLLQLHDFAEDGRPSNYRLIRESLSERGQLYPQAPHVHYAALNQRDLQHLQAAGVPQARSHLLPNPVSAPVQHPEPQALKPLGIDRLMLYPTRAIRRKNLGELLLWAALCQPEAPGLCWATTLRPANPTALPIHERWEAFANELDLPVRFGLGEVEGVDFHRLIQASEALVTTSVAEGFGLAYLEPWLHGKQLIGRDLPEITADFRQAGIDLDHLYPRLEVPIESAELEQLRTKLAEGLAASFEAYECALPKDALEQSLHALYRDERVDFGRLDEALQESIIRRAAAKPGDFPTRPSSPIQPDAERLETNARAIREHYQLEQYGTRLLGIYEQVLAAQTNETPSDLPDASVLERFLLPENFNLLRT